MEKQIFFSHSPFINHIIFFFRNSFHVDIVVQTFVIRAVARTKSRAERSSKSIAIVKIARLKQLATKFAQVSHWTAMKRAPVERKNWNELPSSKSAHAVSRKKKRIAWSWKSLKRNSAKRSTRKGKRKSSKTKIIRIFLSGLELPLP